VRQKRIRELGYHYLLFAGDQCNTFDPAVLGDPLQTHVAEIGGYAVELSIVERGHHVRAVSGSGAPVFAEVFLCGRREQQWRWRPTMQHRFVLGRRPREQMVVMVSEAGGVKTATDLHVYLPSPNPDRYVRSFMERGNIAVPWLGPSLAPRHALTVDRVRNRIFIRSLHEHDVARMGRLSFVTLTQVRLAMLSTTVEPPKTADQRGSVHRAQPRLVWTNGRPVEQDRHEGRESWAIA